MQLSSCHLRNPLSLISFTKRTVRFRIISFNVRWEVRTVRSTPSRPVGTRFISYPKKIKTKPTNSSLCVFLKRVQLLSYPSMHWRDCHAYVFFTGIIWSFTQINGTYDKTVAELPQMTLHSLIILEMPSSPSSYFPTWIPTD